MLRKDFALNTEWMSRATLAVFRLGQHTQGSRGPLRAVWWLLDHVYVQLLVGAELPPTVACGPRLRLPHGGRGVILHPHVTLGAGVTLYHGVTIGLRGTQPLPVLGDDVYVGVGAAILGDVTVGDGARVGAGAVVLKDVPAGALAVGVPARVLERV